MGSKQHPRAAVSRWLWVGALALALLVFGVDTARRLDGIRSATEAAVASRLRPEIDPASPSGYRWNQHRLVLTQTDGYQWLLQAEQELSGGDARVRAVAYDDGVRSREVHWAGFLRWWSLGVARAYRLGHSSLTPAQSLEHVAPWANVLLLLVFLVALTPLIATRLGAGAAGLFALGSVAVHPFYDFFAVGYLDHHGVAAMSCLMVVLCLVAGGVGFVRVDDAPTGKNDPALRDWLPTLDVARRWFIASGVAGAVGLWISAAAMAPVLVGVGVGVPLALLACKGSGPSRAWRFEPGLFRAWGIAGACGSLAFYLLEYFPAHMGMRLEVNHPLYALAFLGGGDLLARVGRRMAPPTGETETISGIGWLVGDLALVLLLPAVILLTGEAHFRLRDPFLWLFHTRSIVEFQPLIAWMRTRTPVQVLGELSLIPLVAMPIAAALWPTDLVGSARLVLRGLLLVAVGSAMILAGIFLLSVTRGNVPMAVVGSAALAALWFLLPWSLRSPPLAAPWKAALILASVPALLLLLVSLFQMRWLGNAAALWLGVLAASASVLVAAGHAQIRTSAGRLGSAALLTAVLVMPPLAFAGAPFVRPNADVVTRDASFWLRRRLGGDSAVVLAAPTPSTHMIWFGGFRGLGTLYWENLEGLRASAEIYSAPDADSARALLARHGVTHVVFLGWDIGFEFEQGAANTADGANRRGFLNQIELEMRAGKPVSLPPWLLPLPYAPATVAGFRHPVLEILEVVDDQAPEVALARLAQFYEAMENAPGVEESLARSVAIRPSVPALALLAQIQWVKEDRLAFIETVDRLRVELARPQSLDLGDRIEAVFALGLRGDGQGVASQLSAALAQADERRLRRLRPERLSLLIDVSRQLGLDREFPDAIATAQRLLPAP